MKHAGAELGTSLVWVKRLGCKQEVDAWSYRASRKTASGSKGVRNPLLTESGSEGKAGLYICCYLAIGQTKYSYLKQIISKVIDRAV